MRIKDEHAKIIKTYIDSDLRRGTTDSADRF